MLSRTNLYQAHKQWATRPADERFANLDDLFEFTTARKRASAENNTAVRDLSLIIDGSDFTINHQQPRAQLTHWSFSQLCRVVGAPAEYLRRLPIDLASTCLEYGIKRSTEKGKLLISESGYTSSSRQLRALTGPQYGRIWDADVIAEIVEATRGSGWKVPEARISNSSDRAGLYASDRDVFVFMVAGEVPIEIGDAKLSRGFFCWNSETGSATFGLMTFLYNFVCGNHIVWGAEQISQLRIVHRADGPRRFVAEALPQLNKFLESRADKQRIVDTVSNAMKQPVGQGLDEVWQWFKDKPFTQKEVVRAWETANSEGENASRLWGMLQGFTSNARRYTHANSRVDLERRAGIMLELTK